jgi:hypothetical protein
MQDRCRPRLIEMQYHEHDRADNDRSQGAIALFQWYLYVTAKSDLFDDTSNGCQQENISPEEPDGYRCVVT